MKNIGWITYKLAMSVMLAYLCFKLMEMISFHIRGYFAIGGELILSIVVGGILYRFGLDKWNNWLKKREEESKKSG